MSAHPDLRDDAKIPEGQRRFLPTHFEISGRAIDALGEECSEIACPKCHLVIPRDIIELPPGFFSILGSPSSGKSYFLSVALWKLRIALDQEFQISFEDSDPTANEKLHEYEETLFVNSQADQLVALPKTELDGDLYEQVEIEPGRTMLLPRAFVFRMRLRPEHPLFGRVRKNGCTLCLYDNAGEHFLPGAQTANSPGTRHLAVSKALLFIFDPTQHHGFRKYCKGKTNDPQITSDNGTYRQDHILAEATKRIRAEIGLTPSERDKRPLIVVLSKYDAWAPMCGSKPLLRDWAVKTTTTGHKRLNIPELKKVSQLFRDILQKVAPEIVTTSEAFAEDVIYIPVSALGCSPQAMPDSTLSAQNSPRLALGVYPADIRPMWADIPLLYAIHRTMPKMIAGVRKHDAELKQKGGES